MGFRARRGLAAAVTSVKQAALADACGARRSDQYFADGKGDLFGPRGCDERAPISSTATVAANDEPPPLLSSPERFINRELSWLEFNRRVLEEAANASHPLLERLRFLSISATNLDEFFMVRVAGLVGQVLSGVAEISDDGRTPAEQLERISERVAALVASQQSRWKALQSELAANGVVILEVGDLTRTRTRVAAGLFPLARFPNSDAACG